MNALSANPIARMLMVAVPVFLAGILLAVEIGSGDLLTPLVFLILVFGFSVFGFLARKVYLEATILVFLLSGYLIGTRGFAQLYIVSPIFVGEAGLAAIALLLITRLSLSRGATSIGGPLGISVLIFICIGTLRFIFLGHLPGIQAIRDFALVYYALFFFFAYYIGQHSPSRDFIEKSLVIAVIIQSVVALITRLDPTLLSFIRVRGVPLLAERDDLLTTFSVCGACILYLDGRSIKSRTLKGIFIVLLVATVLMSSGRAAFLALGVSGILMWIAHRRRLFVYWGATAFFGLLMLVFLSVFAGGESLKPLMDDAGDRLRSLVDFSGQAHYKTSLGDTKVNDNEFRKVFWHTIITDTTQDNPLFGKGFGYDFLPHFEATYGRGTWEGLRSPHNFYITVYGRMGLVGILSFLFVTGMIIRDGIRAAYKVRKNLLDEQVLVFWVGAWAILSAAAVGVVLEGPMGAIVFWSFLGLAASGSYKSRKGKEMIIRPALSSRSREGELLASN